MLEPVIFQPCKKTRACVACFDPSAQYLVEGRDAPCSQHLVEVRDAAPSKSKGMMDWLAFKHRITGICLLFAYELLNTVS